MHPAAAHLRAFAAWTVVLFALWLLLAGQWSPSTAVVGAACALGAAALAETIRSRAAVGVRIPAALLARAVTIPLLVVADFGLLVWVLVRSAAERRPVRGVFVTRPFAATGDAPEERGARAFTTLAATYSPNAYVVDVDCDEGTILLHDLIVWRRSESPA